jgi:hypothetical protein
VARLERWTDRPLTLLAVLLVPSLLAPFVFELSTEAQTALQDVSYGIWSVVGGGGGGRPDRVG